MQEFNVKKTILILFYIFTALLAFISLKSLVDSLIPAHGLRGLYDQYVGRDFLFFYAAAKLTLSGHINDLYVGGFINNINSSVIPELENQTMQLWAWLYPPHYLPLLLPFGFLPYYFALGLWLAVSFLLPAFVLWHFWQMRGGLWLATIFNINVFYCLSMGQNALIFVAIAGMGIALLQKRPLLAGVCFAVLSMKPHFAILLPVALLLGRYYRALLYTILSTLFLVVVSSFSFGWNIWEMAIGHFSSAKTVSLSPDIWFFSVYSTYRALLEIGLSEIYAWCGYFLVATLAFYGFSKVWLGEHTLAAKWLAFSIAALLCSPYNLAYDAVWIALPAMVWLSQKLEQNHRLPTIVYILLAMLVFAIAITSVGNYLTILLIIGALIVLLGLDRGLDKITY